MFKAALLAFPFFLLSATLSPSRNKTPNAGACNDLLNRLEDQWQFGNFGANAIGKVQHEKNKMILSTKNTRHCFFESDSYSFTYQQLPFPYDDCSRQAVTVKIDRFPFGSAGIMMRSDSRLGAANVHLEASATGEILLFYRKKDGESTAYTHIVNLSFPVELKLVRQGTSFTGYYKDKAGEWVKGSSVMADAGMEPLVGFYACSGETSQIGYSGEANGHMDATFYDWTFDYHDNYIPAEKNFTDTMPIAAGTLLRDNFNDGSLSNAPASITNPVWNGIQYGNLPYDEAGGRYWRKTGDGIFYLGDKKWADYEVSIDLAFDAGSKLPNEFMMQLRYQNIAVYAKMARCYAVALRNGNKLFFEKYEGGQVAFSRAVAIPDYFNGTKHRLRVRLLDRDYEVYYDDKQVIAGTDTVRPVTYGNISLKFTNTAMNIDNLEVHKIDDPVNGTTDNYLQDYFDTPIPAFLKKYGF